MGLSNLRFAGEGVRGLESETINRVANIREIAGQNISVGAGGVMWGW